MTLRQRSIHAWLWACLGPLLIGGLLFAILNQGGTPATFRRLQDQLVVEMFGACGGAAPIPYMRAVGFGETAGAFIERAPGNIPESPPVALEGGK